MLKNKFQRNTKQSLFLKTHIIKRRKEKRKHERYLVLLEKFKTVL